MRRFRIDFFSGSTHSGFARALMPLVLVLGLGLATGQVFGQAILNANTVKVGGTTGADLAGDDYKSGSSIPIGFTFNFFGQDKTGFVVNTNGVLFFGIPNAEFNEKPDAALDSLAVMWDDLESKLSRNADELIFYKVLGTAPNRKLMVQWNNYGIYNTNLPFGTMQAILYETTNVIQFQYISLLTSGRSDAKSALVAIRGANGTQVTHTFQGSPVLVQQGTSICWVPSGSSYTKSVINSPNAHCTIDPTQTLTNQTAPPPDKPVGLSRAGSVFSWDAAAHTDTYTLRIATDDKLNGTVLNQAGLTATSLDSGLTFRPGQTYYWVVRAVNAQGTTTSDLQQFRIPLTAPTAVDDSYSVSQAGVLTAGASRNIKDNDSDPQNDPLTASEVTGPAHADSFTLNADGTFTYDPVDTFAGTDTFTYKVNDGSNDSNTATVRISVTDSNFAPSAVDDAYQVAEDGTLRVHSPGVLGNDQDIDVHDHLTAVEVTDPDSLLTLNADGSLVFTPAANFNGTYSATYKVNDGHLDSSAATIRFTVNAVNDVPASAVDAYSVPEDGHLDVLVNTGVLANDRDADGDSLTAVLDSGPASGSLTLNPNGSFNYVPTPLFFGDDSFTYHANDGSVDGAVTTVNIRVNHVNHVPVGNPDAYSLAEDGASTVNVANGVLGNDSDVDKGDHLSARKLATTSDGLLHLNADGSFDYTPNQDFNGSDTFTYEVWDGIAASSPVTATIRVSAVNDDPILHPDSYSIAEDAVLQITSPAKGLLGNDFDPDGDPLIAVPAAPFPANGTLHINSDGTFTYAPNLDFNGTDTFGYTAFDGKIAPLAVLVTITVNPVNDPPLAGGDSYSLFEDSDLQVRIADGLLKNDFDADGDTLVTGSITQPAHGSVQVLSYGDFLYQPDANFNGLDKFTYQAFDGSAGSNTATVVINVRAKNDSPISVDDAYSVGEDGLLKVTTSNGVLANDKDVDADILYVIVDTSPAHGSLQMELDGGFSYRPDPNFNGSDSFTYFVNDGTVNGTSSATVSITVNAVNDPPLAGDNAYSIAEDGFLRVSASQGILGNDIDPDGDSLIALLDVAPTDGALQFSLDGSFTYKPDPGFNGIDAFTYHVNDGNLDSPPVPVTITVNPVNDKPLAGTDAYSVAEDGVLDVNDASGVLANDLDLDGDTLYMVLKTSTAHGHLIINPLGGFNYRPDADFNGTDNFTYAAFDGSVESDPVTVTITVNPVNDPPSSTGNGYSVAEDGTLNVTAGNGLLSNDHDQDGDTLTSVLQSTTSNGTLHANLDGSFSYQPNPNFNGQDSFTYRTNDGSVDSNLATVTIRVNAVNDVPLAASDAYSISQDTLLSVDAANGVLANDIDLDGDQLLAILQSTVSNGTLQMNLDGSFNYTPIPGYSGSDSFTYLVNDGKENSTLATVTLNVHQTNHPPLVAADSYSTARNTVLQIGSAQGVLNNDTDPEGNPLIAAVVDQPQHGTLHLEQDGSFRYTPASDYAGPDSFSYQASDGSLKSTVATVTINVNFTNRAPVARDDAYSIGQDSLLTVDAGKGVLLNDSDADGDAMSVRVQSQPVNGVLHQAQDGSFTYKPTSGFSGIDRYTYMAIDGAEQSNLATVSITVNAVNQAPLAVDDGYSMASDSLLNVDSHHGLLANDADPEGDLLSAVIVSQPQHGALHPQTDGSFSYKPDPGFAGVDTFTYQAKDGQLESNVAKVTINLHKTNQAPVATDDSYSVDENTLLKVMPKGLLSNDTDADGNVLRVVADTAPAHGTLHLLTDGGFSYLPDLDFTGADSFTYKASDGTADSSAATVSIKVDPTYQLRVNVTGQGRVTGGISISTTSAGSSIDCPVNCETSFPAGSTAGLFASLSRDVNLGGWSWSGACPDDQAHCDYLMDSDKVANVVFFCDRIDIPQASVVSLEADWVCYDLRSVDGYEILAPDGEVTFRAEHSITLGPGFRVGDGGVLHAVMAPVSP